MSVPETQGQSYKYGSEFADRKNRPEPVEPSQALHLLRRATYGPTRAGLAELDSLGVAGWLDRQLNPSSIADPDGDAVLAFYPALSYSATQARAGVKAFDDQLIYGLLASTVGRSIWSSRQLHEVMTAFWNDHLHITGAFYDAWDSRHRFDADVIRQHAFGRFADMLQAATRHPAMLAYLDQANSTKTNLNENLGRELLELHTVGSYTEADVLASARMLTGLSVTSTGEADYKPAAHYVGPLTIGDFSHPNPSADGQVALTAYLDHLARHPRTAQRIARKLAVRFVSDNPAADVVAAIAKVYLDNDTRIAPVMRHIFTSAAFKASVGAKVRTPQEDIFAQIRALGFSRPSAPAELKQLYWALWNTGHAPMDWAPPNGFPDVPAHWATPTTALARLSMHMDISGGWWPQFSGYPSVNGTRSLAGLLPNPLPATYGDLVQTLAQRLLFTTVSTQVRDAICSGYLGKTAAEPLKANSSIVQWELPATVALLFDSPAHSVR